jgi:hypothetical protein
VFGVGTSCDYLGSDSEIEFALLVTMMAGKDFQEFLVDEALAMSWIY